MRPREDPATILYRELETVVDRHRRKWLPEPVIAEAIARLVRSAAAQAKVHQRLGGRWQLAGRQQAKADSAEP